MSVARTADVIVVGAGLAGLTAARRIEHGGHPCVVLEAGARIGGRVLTRTVRGVAIDLGAGVVSPSCDRVIALAQSLGVRTVAVDSPGRKVLDHGGSVQPYRGPTPRLRPLALGELGLTLGRLEAMARLVPPGRPMAARLGARWDDTTVEEWLGAHVRSSDARALLTAAIAARFGADAHELSLLSLLFGIHSAGGIAPQLGARGGSEIAFAGGVQMITQRLAARLRSDIQLSTRVHAIARHDADVQLQTSDGTWTARRVVLAVPVAAAARIEFAPALSAARAELHARTPAPRVVRWACTYEGTPWRRDGLSGESLSTDGPMCSTVDATPEGSETGVLLGTVVASAADRLAAQSPTQRRERVLSQLTRMFGSTVAAPLDAIELDWASETPGGGLAAYWPPGVIGRTGRAFRRGIDRVHFAGADTAKRKNGRLDGAIESGERAADEVLEKLGRR